MAKAVSLDQRNLFESEQEHIDRLAGQPFMPARSNTEPALWFSGIPNESYDAIVRKANQIKERIGITHGECWAEEHCGYCGYCELRHDLDKLWQSYSFQVDILMMYNPRGICELAEKAEEEIRKLVSRMNVLDEEGEDIREYLREYELLFDQCIMLGGQPY
jgi:hypothetical protein